MDPFADILGACPQALKLALGLAAAALVRTTLAWAQRQQLLDVGARLQGLLHTLGQRLQATTSVFKRPPVQSSGEGPSAVDAAPEGDSNMQASMLMPRT